MCLEGSLRIWGSAHAGCSECVLGICVFGKLHEFRGVSVYFGPHVFWGLSYGGIHMCLRVMHVSGRSVYVLSICGF